MSSSYTDEIYLVSLTFYISKCSLVLTEMQKTAFICKKKKATQISIFEHVERDRIILQEHLETHMCCLKVVYVAFDFGLSLECCAFLVFNVFAVMAVIVLSIICLEKI